MKTKWSDRVWVGVSKQALSGARTLPEARSVSSIIICRDLEASSKEDQTINKFSKDRHEKIVAKTLRKRCEAFCFYDAL